ncbi:TfoX/Sxy family protein [Mesorhizobium australicum]
MTNKNEQAKEIVERLSPWANVTTKPLFGAVAFYRGEHVFAMLWQGAVYFKVDETTRTDFDAAGSQPSSIKAEANRKPSSPTWRHPQMFWKMTRHLVSGPKRRIGPR